MRSENSFILKKIILFLFAILVPCIIFCQPKQNELLEHLRSGNGFKQIELGADIRQLERDKLSYLDDVDSVDSEGCNKFCYRDSSMLYLGNGLFLKQVGLRTYKDRIVNIYLFFPRGAGHDMLKYFEANYGKSTDVPGEFMFDWKTTGVTLSLRYNQPSEMGIAIFSSDNIAEQMAGENKLKKAGRIPTL
jgi:hypothetical protein